MENNQLTDVEAPKIVYLIPSISIYIPDQIYIYVEAEREYDALALTKIGNSLIPILIEHTRTADEDEMLKLIKETRVWPYPLIWTHPEEAQDRRLRIFRPRLIDNKSTIHLLDSDLIECVMSIEKLWCSAQEKEEQKCREQEDYFTKILKNLFKIRSCIYSLGAEIPNYLYYSYLYLSKSNLCIYDERDQEHNISPWNTIAASIKNTLNILITEAKDESNNYYRLGQILGIYGELFDAELEILRNSIEGNTDKERQLQDHVRRALHNQRELLRILLTENVLEQRRIDCHESVRRDNIYINELAKKDNIYILVLPQRPTSRRSLEKIIRMPLAEECDDQRGAEHSCMLKYVVGGRLCELLKMLANLRGDRDEIWRAIKKIEIWTVCWDDDESKDAMEDLKDYLNRLINIDTNIDRNKNDIITLYKVKDCTRSNLTKEIAQHIMGICKGSSNSQNISTTLVILIIGDYRKDIISIILDSVLRDRENQPSLFGCEPIIIIAPITIYASEYDPCELRKILKVCFLEHDGSISRDGGCLNKEPLRIYIEKLKTSKPGGDPNRI